MDNTMGFISVFLFLLYCVPFCLSFHVVDYEEESKKIFAEMKIENPSPNEKKLARELINQRVQAAYERAEKDKNKKEADDAKKKVGAIEMEKDKAENPLQMLQLRTALEKKVNALYGGKKPDQKSYMNALEDALIGTEKIFTTNPKMIAFREMIKETGMEILAFIEAAKNLYRALSERVAHDSSGYIVPIPEHDDIKKIESILKLGGIDPLPSYLSILSLALKPADLPPMYLRDGNLVCLLITPIQIRDQEEFKPKGDHGISGKDMFPNSATPKPSRAQWVLQRFDEKKNIKLHCVQAVFNSQDDARNALHNNHGYLKEVKVKLDQCGCYEESTDPGKIIEEIVLTEDITPKKPTTTTEKKIIENSRENGKNGGGNVGGSG